MLEATLEGALSHVGLALTRSLLSSRSCNSCTCSLYASNGSGSVLVLVIVLVGWMLTEFTVSGGSVHRHAVSRQYTCIPRTLASYKSCALPHDTVDFMPLTTAFSHIVLGDDDA
jgi:hypothetical protein